MNATPDSPKITPFLLSLSVLLISLFIAGCSESEDSAVTSGVKTVPVRLVVAETTEVTDDLMSVGSVVSKTAPTLAAEINARVVDVLVEEGDAVERGQELVLLDTTGTELARREAEADIQRLQVSISNEERRVQRYRDLKTRDMMPEETLDDAVAKLATDRAALEAARARVAIAEDHLSHARLVSPVQGVVEKRHVSVGDYVKVGGPMISVTDTQSLQAELPFPETVGEKLMPGQELFLISAVAPDLIVATTIETIKPQIGSMSRALVVLANVDNPGPWKPGGTIEGRVIIDKRSNTVVIPAVAVARRPSGNVVYVLDGPDDREVSERVVTVGQRFAGQVEITDGLEAGTWVVADGAYYLTDGAHITVSENQP